jgi:hypothetical protein
MVQLTGVVAAIAVGAVVVNAHPGESHQKKKADLKVRSDYIKSLPEKDLAGCTLKMKSSGTSKMMIKRREDLLHDIRKRNALDVHGQSPIPCEITAPEQWPLNGKLLWIRLTEDRSTTQPDRKEANSRSIEQLVGADHSLAFRLRPTSSGQSLEEGSQKQVGTQCDKRRRTSGRLDPSRTGKISSSLARRDRRPLL